MPSGFGDTHSAQHGEGEANFNPNMSLTEKHLCWGKTESSKGGKAQEKEEECETSNHLILISLPLLLCP